MNKYLTYSILQYKHSLILGEILNVGILFYFHDTFKFQFVIGDATRLKAVYPKFDTSVFNAYRKAIDSKLQSNTSLFSTYPSESDFEDYIHKNILAIDAAGYVFNTPVRVKNIFAENEIAVNEYAKLLLPGINVAKPHIVKHNENYLIKQFEGYLPIANKALEEKLKRDVTLKTKNVTYNFNFSWESNSVNYIKPLSFDLLDDVTIINKALQHRGQLDDLNAYLGSKQKFSFDYLIAKPQDPSLARTFENALDLLDSAEGTKKLIIEDEFDQYSQTILSVI